MVLRIEDPFDKPTKTVYHWVDLSGKRGGSRDIGVAQ
jgi:hypothetical protein